MHKVSGLCMNVNKISTYPGWRNNRENICGMWITVAGAMNLDARFKSMNVWECAYQWIFLLRHTWRTRDNRSREYRVFCALYLYLNIYIRQTCIQFTANQKGDVLPKTWKKLSQSSIPSCHSNRNYFRSPRGFSTKLLIPGIFLYSCRFKRSFGTPVFDWDGISARKLVISIAHFLRIFSKR